MRAAYNTRREPLRSGRRSCGCKGWLAGQRSVPSACRVKRRARKAMRKRGTCEFRRAIDDHSRGCFRRCKLISRGRGRFTCRSKFGQTCRETDVYVPEESQYACELLLPAFSLDSPVRTPDQTDDGEEAGFCLRQSPLAGRLPGSIHIDHQKLGTCPIKQPTRRGKRRAREHVLLKERA
jgi:hypothetical protein